MRAEISACAKEYLLPVRSFSHVREFTFPFEIVRTYILFAVIFVCVCKHWESNYHFNIVDVPTKLHSEASIPMCERTIFDIDEDNDDVDAAECFCAPNLPLLAYYRDRFDFVV